MSVWTCLAIGAGPEYVVDAVVDEVTNARNLWCYRLSLRDEYRDRRLRPTFRWRVATRRYRRLLGCTTERPSVPSPVQSPVPATDNRPGDAGTDAGGPLAAGIELPDVGRTRPPVLLVHSTSSMPLPVKSLVSRRSGSCAIRELAVVPRSTLPAHCVFDSSHSLASPVVGSNHRMPSVPFPVQSPVPATL